MNQIITVFVLLCATSVTAWAEEETKLGSPYFLGKLGMLEVDLNRADPIYTLGLMVGGEVLARDVTAEFDFDYGLDGGKYENTDGSKAQYHVWTLAAYLGYRLPLFHGFYLKAKGGYLYESVTHKRDAGDTTRSDHGLSAGGGLGVVINNILGKRVTFELQYTQVEKDIVATQLDIHVPF